jgi:hypothetical protein
MKYMFPTDSVSPGSKPKAAALPSVGVKVSLVPSGRVKVTEMLHMLGVFWMMQLLLQSLDRWRRIYPEVNQQGLSEPYEVWVNAEICSSVAVHRIY